MRALWRIDMNNLVSIIMPCFNGERFLKESIESVLRQTYSNYELIIVDDNSSDQSFRIASEYAACNPRIIVKRNTDSRGAAKARNLALSVASGRYICFLDCDDVWLEDKLVRQIEFMNKHDLAFTWASYNIIDRVGLHIRSHIIKCNSDFAAILSKREVIGCLTTMYDTKKIGKVLMPEIRMRNDYALWLRIMAICDRNGFSYQGMRNAVANLRLHPGSMTSNKFKAAYYQWKLYRQHAKLSVLRSVYFMAQYIFNGLNDRLKARNLPGHS
jgi:teichuronic acid biosynthesis glycosyltransferase TuaG